ncbi:hypothetical protein QM012_002417 [Aureobasidium pullulans]|uniref:Uncharacterized protein n=1 Tax=Aureobasidium pullulans TaxID=5580 RepID=A0ABR0TCR3_AURPU
MSTTTTTTISPTIAQLNNPTLSLLSDRISSTQTLLSLHEKTRKTHKTAFKRHIKNALASLDNSTGSSGDAKDALMQMDMGIELQKRICDETEEMARYARELVELLEMRQNVIRGIVKEEGQMGS